MLYILTVCLLNEPELGPLRPLLNQAQMPLSDPGLLISVPGRVLVGQFSENLPPSTCD